MTDDPTGERAEPAETDPSAYDSLGIALPHGWIQLPLDRAGFDRFHSELAEHWVASGWDRTTRRRAEILLRRIRRDLVRAGLQLAALYVSGPQPEATEQSATMGTPIEAEEDPSAADVMMATCAITTYTQADLGSKLPLTLTNLIMAFGGRRAHDSTGSQEQITNLEHPVVDELPVGKSVHLRRLYELDGAGPLPERFYGETFLTPVGDDGQVCLVTHFTTINLRLSKLFSELFAGMAATLTLFRPDDPTEFESDWVDLFDEP